MEAHRQFSETYRSLVERFVRPLRPEDGVSEPVLRAGERRLGFRLPLILRAFYLLAGNLKRINRVQERLLPPENPNRIPRTFTELTVVGGGLAVYIENQGGCVWGIECSSLDDRDPPVAIALDIDQPIWEPFHDRLSGFLVAMFYHQAAHCGLRWGAVAKANASLVEQVRRNWPVEARFGNAYIPSDREAEEATPEFFGSGGQLLSFRNENLWVSTKTQEDREAVRRQLGISWDSRFPEDFPPTNSTLVDGWED
ncbi:MAG TPA: hypothetical protein VKU02_00395 [Gemmataceae bacterium]|nr:hypothetical protein [Gemmataceae bacterium]